MFDQWLRKVNLKLRDGQEIFSLDLRIAVRPVLVGLDPIQKVGIDLCVAPEIDDADFRFRVFRVGETETEKRGVFFRREPVSDAVDGQLVDEIRNI